MLTGAGIAQQYAPTGPVHDSGQGVTPAFEGWFRNPDGTYCILFGYFNRNQKQELDVPVGAENRIEPGGPDQGQPTHFLPKRQWGVFTVTAPKDFGTRKLSWTLTANGKTTSIPANLDSLWELSPLLDATGNTPPFVAFDAAGPFVQGPRGQSVSLSADVGHAMPLTVWVADDANVVPGATALKSPAVTVSLSKFRGPGMVTFENARPVVERAEFDGPAKTVFRGRATTAATFSEPGEYVLRVQANDWSGEGGRGFQCCWSNGWIKVTARKSNEP